MDSNLILGLLGIHYVCDFIFQKREDAEKKSTSIKHLFSHVVDYYIYTTILLIILLYAMGYNTTAFVPYAISYSFWLGILHFFTDLLTSKMNSYSIKNKRIKEFWIGIGVDQLLHQIQIIILYQLFMHCTF